jgi:hypothetical protein
LREAIDQPPNKPAIFVIRQKLRHRSRKTSSKSPIDSPREHGTTVASLILRCEGVLPESHDTTTTTAIANCPLTLRCDFDQQWISRLNTVGIPEDSCTVAKSAKRCQTQQGVSQSGAASRGLALEQSAPVVFRHVGRKGSAVGMTTAAISRRSGASRFASDERRTHSTPPQRQSQLPVRRQKLGDYCHEETGPENDHSPNKEGHEFQRPSLTPLCSSNWQSSFRND